MATCIQKVRQALGGDADKDLSGNVMLIQLIAALLVIMDRIPMTHEAAIMSHCVVIVGAIVALAAAIYWEVEAPWYPSIPLSGPGGFFAGKLMCAALWVIVLVVYVSHTAKLLGLMG